MTFLNKIIGLIRKFQNILPWLLLVTFYKLPVRPHLDHRDIIYNKVNNSNFLLKPESI